MLRLRAVWWSEHTRGKKPRLTLLAIVPTVADAAKCPIFARKTINRSIESDPIRLLQVATDWLAEIEQTLKPIPAVQRCETVLL
jgi:hypothetical protein